MPEPVEIQTHRQGHQNGGQHGELIPGFHDYRHAGEKQHDLPRHGHAGGDDVAPVLGVDVEPIFCCNRNGM